MSSHDEGKGLTTEEAEELHAKYGYNEVKTAQMPEWKKILLRYLDWVSIVILITALLSVIIPVDGTRGWVSFGLLMFELNLIVWVGYYSDRNAGNAVKELESMAAPQAVVKRDGRWTKLNCRELVTGDIIELKGGDVIPADAVLIGEGEPMKIDEAALTGESLPVTKRPGDAILSGAIVTQGELEARVTNIGADSFFGKTIALIEAGTDVGHLQIVLDRVSKALGVIGGALVLVILVVVIVAQKQGAGYAIVLSFVIFVSVVPIGMPVVTTTVLAVGARELAEEKAIVSRLSAMEELSGMEILCSDKTGTLTKNILSLDKEDIVAWGDNTADEVLLQAALSARWENQDAIDRAMTGSLDDDRSRIADFTIKRFVPFNPVDKKTLATVVDARTNTEYVTCKGAPHIVGDMLDDPAAKAEVEKYIDERASRGLRSLGVCKSLDGEKTWELVGLISLLDPPRDDSAATIVRAQGLGIAVKMVTGDQLAIAIETCKRLGMGGNIMPSSELTKEGVTSESIGRQSEMVDGFAGVFPEHKYQIVDTLQARGRLIGMTGDGVNDAPALKKANVGIAVAGATEAAKGAADIILTQPGISTIITAIVGSRRIFRRLQTYIIYRMASSLLILFFFFFSIIVMSFDFPTWVLVLTSIQNDLSVMTTSFDNVFSSDYPEIWNMTKCLTVAFFIGTISALGSLIAVYTNSCKLENADPYMTCNYANFWPSMGFHLVEGFPETCTTYDCNGLRTLFDARVVATIYLQLSVSIQLSIFATRTPSFFWKFGKRTSPPPSPLLVGPVFVMLAISTFISVYWPSDVKLGGGAPMAGCGWRAAGVSWLMGIVWFIIADFVKVPVFTTFMNLDKEKIKAKETGVPYSGWMKVLDKPGAIADSIMTGFDNCFSVVTAPFKDLLKVITGNLVSSDKPVKRWGSVPNMKGSTALSTVMTSRANLDM